MMRSLMALAALVLLTAEPAFAVAHSPSISGNAWIALVLLLGFFGLIVMVVFGTLHVEKRDARLGRRGGDRGFLLPVDDDDDGHHHGHF